MTKPLLLTKRILFLGVFSLLLLFSNALKAQLNVSFDVTDAVCYNLPNGSITATAFNGTPLYSYQWSTGDSGPTITGLNAGTYSVTVTDAAAASIVRSVVVNQPSLVTVTLVPDDLCNEPFNITAVGNGGVPPYNYNWSNGAMTQTITNVSSGEYCVTITDTHLCGATLCITPVATPANVGVNVNNVTCPGGTNGSITAIPSSGLAPFTYAWSNGNVGQTITNLSAGTYIVTMTDANGCTDTAVGVVNQPPPIIVSLSPNMPICPGDLNGSINSFVSGGTPPYNLSWSTGQNTPSITNLGPGTYSLTVVDANNCIQSASVTLTSVSNLTLGGLGTPETCPDANDGFVTASPQNGVMPYTFLWNTGFNAQVIENAAPGAYTVTVTDAVGCVAVRTIIVPAAPDFTAIVSSANPSTCGVNNGSATAVVTAGAGPFTYQWNTGQTTQVITNLGAGVYTVTITNSSECTVVASTTIIAPPNVFINATATNILCPGASFGTATATVSGGTPPFTVTWSNGGVGNTINGLMAGTYTATVVDANGCSDTDVVIIAQAPAVTFNLTGTEIVCGAGNLGNATATPLTGTPPFNFSWSNGGNSSTVTGLTQGIHTVTVTDANGCSAARSITINIIDDLNVTVTGSNVLCAGESTGSATAFPSGGDAPYTFAWSNGSNTQSISGLSVGTHTILITDANGCTATGSYTVTQPNPLSVSIQSTNPLVCFGQADASLTAIGAGGTPAYSYAWSNGQVGQTITNLPAGTYTVTVTDANECTASTSFTVGQTSELDVNLTGETIVCGEEDGGFAGTVVTGGMPPYSYLWSNSAMTESITNLVSGTYSVTVTDNLGCTSEASITINVISDLAVNLIPRNALCFGDDSGSVLAIASGGDGSYTYNWSNAAGNVNEITGLVAGNYSVTVTEGNGCTATATVSVSQPQMLVATTTGTAPLCNGEATGTATVNVVGGTAPYSYVWNNGAGNVSSQNGLTAGNYVIVVTDANFCTATTSINLIDPPAMNVNVTAPTITCNGTETGSATAIVTGGALGYTYLWSDGQTTATAVNLGAGSYSLTVMDANGCTQVVNTIVINELPSVEVDFNITHLECTTSPVGAITATASMGAAPYFYAWSNGQNGATINSLTAGVYTVTVTDANGCRVVRSAEVTQTAGFTINVQGTNVTCFENSDGSATVITTGGTEPFSYIWSNGDASQTINNLTADIYSVTVTDASECTATGTVSISKPTQLVAGISSNNMICGGDMNGSATATPTGGTPPYSYEWDNGESTQTISNLAVGTYVLTVTDANECTAVNSVTITAPAMLTVTITQNSGTCNNVTDGILVANVFGGSGPFMYAWSNGNMNSTASNLAPGTYSVTVTDNNGCTATSTAALTTYPAPSCSVTVLQPSTLGNNGSLQVNPTSGTAPYSYNWSNGGDTQVISGLAPGVYTVTVTDVNGCQTTCSGSLDALAGIGNFVWEDIDHDGQQDPDEPVIPGVTVNLKNAAGVVIATTTTDSNGEYYFLGLDPGTYSVQFIIPDGMDYTASNMGDDALDSDIVPGMNGMTATYTLDPGELDFTVDAGLYVPPNGAIGDPCSCLNNSTTETNGQFSETFTVRSYPNEIWTVIDGAGMFELNSGEPPASPIPFSYPQVMEETEPGVYEYTFLLVHDISYTVYATNNFDTLDISNHCTYPTLNIEQLPDETLCLADAPIELGANPNIDGNLIFTINGVPTTTIDPLVLNEGSFELVAHLVPFDPEECEANVETQFTITSDCLAQVGDRVWLDLNCDGIQGGNEPGVPGVEVNIQGTAEFLDPDVDMTTFTDANGNYSFMVPPGNYKLTFGTVAGYDLSPQNAGGNDEADSDVSPITMMTEIFHLNAYETNLSFDMGLCPDCINIDYPGAIGYNQYLCAPGNDPEPLVSLAEPSGGDGPIEYLWMHTTGLPNTPIQSWQPIPNSNSPTYDPGPVFYTTYYARCARTLDCGTYIETNIIVIEVGDETTATISGSDLVCLNGVSTFTAVDVEPGSQIVWNFPGGTPATATGATASTTYTTGGYHTVELIVTYDGCTAYDYLRVLTTTLPTVCGQGLIINTDVTNATDGDVMVSWEMNVAPTGLMYHVEHSNDGDNFDRIATVTDETQILNGIRYFNYESHAPKMGLNYYRVQIEDANGNTVYSNIEEVILYTDSKIAMLYPNPVTNELHIEIFETFDEQEVALDVYAVSGQKMATITVENGNRNVEIDFDQFPAGAYLIRLRLGETNVRTMKVIKR